ncbi:uncharacterized protein LOC117005048 [Catharus ustulatus]|uniref:uncharacterized protein LOC117005048 n=1 Tax=Catharus ustulatus TaxID=91951 RepID=UPI00140E4F3D|nr:uncharacterized protein LOC117005048 [Catharus ustulatus]
MYTDSKYAYGVIHTFGKIWEERGLINSQGKGLVHEALITKALKALRGLEKIAVVHIKGHQKGTSPEIRGNNLADQEAKLASLLTLSQKPDTEESHTQSLRFPFTNTEEAKLREMGVAEKDGVWELPDGRQVVPKAIASRIMRKIHSTTHWGTQALVDRFAIKYMCIGVYNVAKGIIGGCLTCQKVNKRQLREHTPGGRSLAYRPFAKIQIDFTELPKVGRYKYLLVMVDHLTHYVEAVPTARQTANTVVKILFENIIPRDGNIEVIDSDRGPHFVSKTVQKALEPLGTKWEFHTPWHPQSSGRVERMNGEIKKQLTKLMIETKMPWLKYLPMALLNIQTQPCTDIGISPFEMLYGMLYDMEFPADRPPLDDKSIHPYVMKIMKKRQEYWKKGLVVQRSPLEIALHSIQPGDMMLIKAWKEASLTSRWEGPFLVLLTTDTAVRTAERGWTHASRVKGPLPQDRWDVVSNQDLKLTLRRRGKD